MPAAARKTDNTKHDNPHCHAPIHPPAPVPTPVAHPAIPHAILSATAPTVKSNSLDNAIITSITKVCTLPSCVPNGPGMIAKGSSTVIIGGLPAARKDDMLAWSGCVAPIPSPTGKVIAPCSSDVIIGG